MDWQLANKRVLVTGASTGIGAAIAQAFGEAGAHVAVHYNASRDAAEEVAKAVRAHGASAEVLQADLAEPDGPRQVVETATRQLDGLDVLVNNAGDLVGRQRVDELDDDFVERVTSLNYYSAVRACRSAIPRLRERGGGAIVNMTSIAARTGGGSGASMYAASKAAVSAFTRALSKEVVGDGIRVNALSPGVIATPFHERNTPPEVMEGFKQQIPMGRPGTPEECAGAALFFASEATAGYITGQVLEINGGQLLG